MSVGRYYLLTIPHEHFPPFLPNGIVYIKGQLERGDGGFLHWQLVAVWPKSKCHLSLCYCYLTFDRCQIVSCQKVVWAVPRGAYQGT